MSLELEQSLCLLTLHEQPLESYMVVKSVGSEV